MAVNGVELKIGQRWVTHSGTIGTLRLSSHTTYPWLLDLDDGTGSYSYTNNGRFDIEGYTTYLDLKEIIEDCHNSSSSYSIEEISAAFNALGWFTNKICLLEDKLRELKDPEYAEYLRLKNKFEIKDKN